MKISGTGTDCLVLKPTGMRFRSAKMFLYVNYMFYVIIPHVKLD